MQIGTCASEVAAVEAVPCEKIDVGGARVGNEVLDARDMGSDFPGLTPEIQLVTRPPNANF